MKPLGFPLLTDENIHPAVVAALVSRGKNVRTVESEGLLAADDRLVLNRSIETGELLLHTMLTSVRWRYNKDRLFSASFIFDQGTSTLCLSRKSLLRSTKVRTTSNHLSYSSRNVDKQRSEFAFVSRDDDRR